MVSLYRHFSGSKLLYVGISANPLHRLYQHEKTAEWFDLITRVDIEHYSNLESALKAEAKAIAEEKPAYNIVYNRHNTKRVFRKNEQSMRLKVDESIVNQYPLVVAERKDILKFHQNRWGLKWIADHFGTTIEVIRYVIRKDLLHNKINRQFPNGIMSEVEA